MRIWSLDESFETGSPLLERPELVTSQTTSSIPTYGLYTRTKVEREPLTFATFVGRLAVG